MAKQGRFLGWLAVLGISDDITGTTQDIIEFIQEEIDISSLQTDLMIGIISPDKTDTISVAAIGPNSINSVQWNPMPVEEGDVVAFSYNISAERCEELYAGILTIPNQVEYFDEKELIEKLKSMDMWHEPEQQQFEQEDAKLFKTIHDTVQRVLNDDHTKAAFQELKNGLEQMHYPDPENLNTKASPKLVDDLAQRSARGAVDIISSSVTIAVYEAICFYHDRIIDKMQKNNQEIMNIMQEQLARVNVLEMKLGRIETDKITEKVMREIND